MERLSIEETGLADLPRIRGHHLNLLFMLYNMAHRDGLELAYDGYESVLPEIDELIRKWAFQISQNVKIPTLGWFTPEKTKKEYEYAFDVLGEGWKDQETYIQKLHLAANRFISAAPENQVLLTQTPDILCSACKVGNHCLERGFSDPSTNADAILISLYVSRIQALGRPVKNYYEKYTFSNQEIEEEVPIILTNFGDLRLYLLGVKLVTQTPKP